MKSIFESLENLNVSEACYNDILEGIVSALTPYLSGPEGKKDSFGSKVDRFSARHPKIFKVASKIDGAVHKVDTALKKKEPMYKSPEDALKTMKPAGSIYGKNMYSDEQQKYANELAKKKVPTNKYIWQK